MADHENDDAGTSSHREVDEVLAMLAHEIRGHLNEIVLVQGLLLAEGRLGPLTADQQARVRQIGRTAGRVAGLLEGLTDLSRGRDSAGGAQPLDVAALVGEVAGQLRAEMASAPHVSIEIEPNLPPLRGDPAMVRTVVRTLIQMLIKHSVAAHGTVALRIRPAAAAIAVEVSGNGLPTRRGKPQAGVRLALYTAARTVEPAGGCVELGDDGSLRVTVPDQP